MGCSDLEGFGFRTKDFLPNTRALAAAADSDSGKDLKLDKCEIKEEAQWVASIQK